MKLLPDPDSTKTFSSTGMAGAAAACAVVLAVSLVAARSMLADTPTAVDVGLSLFFVVTSCWLLACAIKFARLARRREDSGER